MCVYSVRNRGFNQSEERSRLARANQGISSVGSARMGALLATQADRAIAKAEPVRVHRSASTRLQRIRLRTRAGATKIGQPGSLSQARAHCCARSICAHLRCCFAPEASEWQASNKPCCGSSSRRICYPQARSWTDEGPRKQPGDAVSA